MDHLTLNELTEQTFMDVTPAELREYAEGSGMTPLEFSDYLDGISEAIG